MFLVSAIKKIATKKILTLSHHLPGLQGAWQTQWLRCRGQLNLNFDFDLDFSKFNEIPLDFNGIPWNSLEFQWVAVKFIGIQLNFIEMNPTVNPTEFNWNPLQFQFQLNFTQIHCDPKFARESVFWSRGVNIRDLNSFYFRVTITSGKLLWKSSFRNYFWASYLKNFSYKFHSTEFLGTKFIWVNIF